MNILATQDYPTPNLVRFFDDVRFSDYFLQIKGSAGLKSQNYPSDYDLFTAIGKDHSVEEIYDQLMEILHNIGSNPDMFFIELKVSNKSGSKKTKFYSENDISFNKFKKAMKGASYFKIDLVIDLDGVLKEMSIIYSLTDKNDIADSDSKSLKLDYKELLKEGSYYKALKRLFSLLRIAKRKNDLVFLTDFFNSEYGELYQKTSGLNAILLLLKSYTNPKIIIRARNELKHLDYYFRPTKKNIEKQISKNMKIVNDEAKKVINELKLK